MNYYLDVWRDYFDFSGRARRKEYWFFTLYHGVVVVAGEILLLTGHSWQTPLGVALGTAVGLYILASIIPTIAVTVRRLHDIDKSGWWYFISFVPLIGGVWLLILMCTDGTSGPNQYGPDPKAVATQAKLSW